MEYWSEHPPAYVSLHVIAQALGAKMKGGKKRPSPVKQAPSSAPSNNEVNEEDMSALIAMFGNPVKKHG